MFRRLAPNTARTAVQGARAYFYPGAGETGISASTMKVILKITCVATVIECIGYWRICFGTYSTKHQLLQDSTDLYYSDGTVMQGEEAVANLKIHHDRMMPFMDEMKEKIDAAV